MNGLPAGQRLRSGEARLEVAIVCTPCGQVERIRPGLRKEVVAAECYVGYSKAESSALAIRLKNSRDR